MSQTQINSNIAPTQNQMQASLSQAQLSQISIANLPTDDRSDRFRILMKEEGAENEHTSDVRRKDKRNRSKPEASNSKPEETKKKDNSEAVVADPALAGHIQSAQQQDNTSEAAGMKGLFNDMLAAAKKDLSLFSEADFAMQGNTSVLLGAVDAGTDIALTPAKNGELTTGLLAAASDLRGMQFRNILDYLVQTVSKARAADDGMGMSLMLRQDLLPATELAVEAMRGQLQVTFITESQASHTLLSSMLPNLEAILASQFGDRSVNIALKNPVPTQGADGNMPQENGNAFSQNQSQERG